MSTKKYRRDIRLKNKFKSLLALGLASAQLAGLVSVSAYAENETDSGYSRGVSDEQDRITEQRQADEARTGYYEEEYNVSPFDFTAQASEALHIETLPLEITSDFSGTYDAYLSKVDYEGVNSLDITLTIENISDKDVTFTQKCVHGDNVPPITLNANGKTFEAKDFASLESDTVTLKPGETRKCVFTIDWTKINETDKYFVTLNTYAGEHSFKNSIFINGEKTEATTEYLLEVPEDVDIAGIDSGAYLLDNSNNSNYMYTNNWGVSWGSEPFVLLDSDFKPEVKEITVACGDTILTSNAIDYENHKIVFKKYADLREVTFNVPEGHIISNFSIYEDRDNSADYARAYNFDSVDLGEGTNVKLNLSKGRTYHYEFILEESTTNFRYYIQGDVKSEDSVINLSADKIEVVGVNVNTPRVPMYVGADYENKYSYFNYETNSTDSELKAPSGTFNTDLTVSYSKGNIYYNFKEFNTKSQSLKVGNTISGAFDISETSVYDNDSIRITFKDLFDEYKNIVTRINSRGSDFKAVFTFKNNADGKEYTSEQGIYSIYNKTEGFTSYNYVDLPEDIVAGDYSVSVRIKSDAYQKVTVSGDCKVYSDYGEMLIPSGESEVPKGTLEIRPEYKEGYNAVIKIDGVVSSEDWVELGDKPVKIEVIHEPANTVKLSEDVTVTTADGKTVKDGDKFGGDAVLTVAPKAKEGFTAAVYVNGEEITGGSFKVGNRSGELLIEVVYNEIPEDMGALEVSADPMNFEFYEGYTEEDAKAAAKKVTLTNIGSGTITSAVTTSDSDEFVIITGDKTDIESKKSAEFTITPRVGLEKGVNDGFIGFSGENSANNPADIAFTITVKELGEQKAPSVPALEKATRSAITLKAIPENENGAKAQYRMNGGEWQDSNVFEGLKANADYTFEARYIAVEGFKESEPSLKAVYTTEKSSNNNNNNNNNHRPSYGGGSVGGGGSSSTTPNIIPDSSPTDSSGKKTTWNDVSSQISEGKDVGTVTLGENPVVPASVIKTIADNKKTVTFKVDDTYSWVVDGGNISGMVSSASFKVEKADIIQATVNQTVGLANVTENNVKTFKLDGVSFGLKPQLKVSLGAANNNKFANLYKRNDKGDLEFVGTAKIAPDGTAEVPVKDNGSYVIAVDSESKLPGDFSNDGKLDVFDVSAILKEIASGNISSALYKADVNGDGVVNALDALEILRFVIKQST